MRWKPLLWFLVSICCFWGAAHFWRLGERWAGREAKPQSPAPAASNAAAGAGGAPFKLSSTAASLQAAPAPSATYSNASPRTEYRLSNTTEPYRSFARKDTAILLENALVDTATGAPLEIPQHLRSKGDPGAWIVQARGPSNKAFQQWLENSGARIVAYIPNNAYLVRAAEAVADQLRGSGQAQAVMAFEPYYKLKHDLLKRAYHGAVPGLELPEDAMLNVLLFGDARDATLAGLEALGARVMREHTSPFGPVLQVQPPQWSLAAIAGLPGVQAVEMAMRRVPANDLSRVALGVSFDPITETNYLGLTGTNVLISTTEDGVDATHEDLAGRVFFDPLVPPTDLSGHGTHMAGIMIGNGSRSETVTNAQGSPMPAAEGQFRGKAPGGSLFVMPWDAPDDYLQELTARTNAFIANQSWTYDVNDYDLAAASYDAAVRDSLPGRTGSQPILYVFAAGNRGNLNKYFGGPFDAGTGGTPDSILSPATAKNVITVGAIEQFRDITNEVIDCSSDPCMTNAPWRPTTDSSDQVAGFSSRGNVGIGIEGDFGRFKPDVVAPGTFILSTRSSGWDQNSYYNPITESRRDLPGLQAPPNGLWVDALFVPANATRVTIQVLPNRSSPSPFPILPIYVRQSAPPTTNVFDFVDRDNLLSMPPDAPLSPVGTSWFYAIGNETAQTITFDVITTVFFTNSAGSFMEVLSNLNHTVGPYYRYESGSSLAAAGVSGTLALMQEFFEQRLGKTNSPAMMKALLINGARSAGNQYDFQVESSINYQGWGVVNLPGSIHPGLTNQDASAQSMLLVDQNPTNALATGQRRTFNVQLSPEAIEAPLRVTLVWTDPPGNPVAGVKLVNDLDLIVTNLQTGEIYFGNDFAAGSDFTQPWISSNNIPAKVDTINNVENVFLAPNFFAALGTNYSITVVGSRVNVNAVTAHPNDVAQDFALVVSSGRGESTNSLTVQGPAEGALTTSNVPLVTGITNMFPASGTDQGGILMNQHVGASSPLLGTNQIPTDTGSGRITIGVPNQWHFYVLTNTTDYTNAAFLTFLPPTLGLPRMGTRESDLDNSSRPEADIDLYVSQDPRLIQLDPAVLASRSTRKSLSPGGTETVVFSNAVRGDFYIGVKSEDQQAAEFAILGVVSLLPFSTEDANGNQLLRGFPLPAFLPDGSPQDPGISFVFGIAVSPIKVRRVTVTNVITHELLGDLIGSIKHGQNSVVLNNHSTNIAVINERFVYDDSNERDLPESQHSDGPGSLMDFGGEEGVGQWMLTQIDNAPGHVGTNVAYGVFLYRQEDPTEGIDATLQPGASRVDFIDVPGDATNLNVRVAITSGTGPVSVRVCPVDGLPSECAFAIASTTNIAEINISTAGMPQLRPGTYSITTSNMNQVDPVDINIRARLDLNQGVVALSIPSTGGPTRILDDAITYSSIDINTRQRIYNMDVGLLLRHPRVSDLAITLISPDGTRALLFENRGNTTSSGLGSFGGTNGASTNLVSLFSADFDSAPTGLYAEGARLQGWTVTSNIVGVMPDFSIPWRSNHFVLLGDGTISNTLATSDLGGHRLSFEVTHAPHLVGTVGWWPFEGDATDIFSGLSGILRGNVLITDGLVGQAFYGDGSATRMIVDAAPELNVGIARGLTVEGWIYPSNTAVAAPLVQWTHPLNERVPGVQLWLGDLRTNRAVEGAFSAALRGVDGSLNPVSTPSLVVTNGGWQHVAVTYDPAALTARLYLNAQPVATEVFTNDFVPLTGGDLYFGFDPSRTPGRAYAGGLDEFGIYERVLSECELQAIVRAGSAGKYGTNVLTCPVAVELDLDLGGGNRNVYTFTNGAGTNWLAGPRWETNTIDFANASGAPARVVIRPLDPNVTIDNVQLFTSATSSQDGLLHFTDDTNITSQLIKFAPTPYQFTSTTLSDPFVGTFVNATSRVYATGEIIPGYTNASGATQSWNVALGPVTVISNELLNPVLTNSLSMSTGLVETVLPTESGRRYRLSYRMRGPGAVSWWNGDINPLNRRAFDLLGGNDGALIGASSQPTSWVASAFSGRVPTSLFFPGFRTNQLPSKMELGDPENLRLTNSFTIEGWILPVPQTNAVAEREQILFRGDSRPGLDPYFLSLEHVDALTSELRFHVEGANGLSGEVLTTGGAIDRGTNWQHVAAVFEIGPQRQVLAGTNTVTVSSNMMRLYVNGELVESSLTSAAPLRDLDPAYSPGIAIGNRSRENYSEPYHGYIDELTIYGRALTPGEIFAIGTNPAGKADLTVPMGESLAKLEVRLDDVLVQTVSGDNADWTERAFVFTARRTNTVLRLASLLPGTFIDSVEMTEIPGELSFLPEQSLDIFSGKEAFGTWRLEIWDNRAGAFLNDPTLVTWQLDFRLLPMAVPTPVELLHGIPFTGALAPGDLRAFVVNVPQWAERATNVLLYAQDGGGNPANVGVLYNTNFIPTYPTNTLFWPPVPFGTNVLTTQPGSRPPLWVGQPYYLTVTNNNPFPVTFSFGVWFDIQTLENCVPQTNFVGPAGFARYFQFDVPTNTPPEELMPKNASFWLTGVNTNVTVVLSQSLPLPDLDNYDYISRAPSTNDEIAMVLTNSTPFPLQTNRWYVGVFNTGDSPVPFTVEACYSAQYPTIIPLIADVPITAEATNAFGAPPGPPRWFFYEFEVTNRVAGVLFELYGLTGDADLVLQRDVPPTMAPYFRTSYAFGTNSEQIVLRPSSHTPDLRGRYILGIYNNETNPVGYTIRASVTQPNGLLVSGEPLRMDLTPVPGLGPLLGWNAVSGEPYTIQFSRSLLIQVWTNVAHVTATTPYATFQVAGFPPGGGYWRVVHGVVAEPPPPVPVLKVVSWTNNTVRISWPTAFSDWRLQYSDFNFVDWREWDTNAHPIYIIGDEYVTFDDVIPGRPRYYRLWQGEIPPPPVLVTNLIITAISNNQLRIEWPTNLVGYRLQWAAPDFIWNEWNTNTNPINVEGSNYVTFDTLTNFVKFYRLYSGPALPPPPPVQPPLSFQRSNDVLYISWPTNPPGYRLQYSQGDFRTWFEWPTNTNPITVVGSNYVTFDSLTNGLRFYRLFRGVAPPPDTPPVLGFSRSINQNEIMISWPVIPAGWRLQYAEGSFTTWNEWNTNTNPITVAGQNYVTFDTIGPVPRFYRLVQGAPPPPPDVAPPLSFRKVSDTQIQISWPAIPDGFRLQYTDGNFTVWNEWTNPVELNGTNYVTFDTLTSLRFYRLVKGTLPPPPTAPSLSFARTAIDEIQISWPTNPPGYRLQFTTGNFTTWLDWTNNITVQGSNYVTTDLIGTIKFYRLVQGPPPTPPTNEPVLTFLQASPTEMYLAWPTNWTGYQLQYSDGNLTNWVDWDGTNTVRVVGENYVLTDSIRDTSRFYRLVKTAPAPPVQAPAVTVGRIDATHLRIAWPVAFAGYRLQYSDGSLANWIYWDTLSAPISVTGQEYETTDTIGVGARFYRLVGP